MKPLRAVSDQSGSRKCKTSSILHAIAVLGVKDKRFASRAKASSEKNQLALSCGSRSLTPPRGERTFSQASAALWRIDGDWPAWRRGVDRPRARSHRAMLEGVPMLSKIHSARKLLYNWAVRPLSPLPERPEVFRQFQPLPLIVRHRRRAIERVGTVRELFEHEAADGLAVFEQKRYVAAPDL